jgi:hypothetical protein
MSKRTRARGLIQFGKGITPENLVSYEEFNDGDGPQPVVCQRCAHGPPVVAAVRDVCVRCLAAVCMSRATEEAMTHMRQPEIRCMQCVAMALEQEKGDPGGA